MRHVLTVILMLTVPGGAMAQEQGLSFGANGATPETDAPTKPLEDLTAIRAGVQGCRDKLADNARLACFDELGEKVLGVQKTQAEVSAASEWESRTSTDPLTDLPEIRIGLRSSTKVPNSIGTSGDSLLIIGCRKNTTELIVSWPSYLGSDSVAVRYRIDDGSIERGTWTPATGGQAAGLWTGARSIPLLKRLIGAKKFTVAMAGYDSGEASAVFNLAGLDETIKPLREICKW